jgi:multidrug resistance efflux pump
MSILTRSNRLFWFFGLILLVGTAAGAGWVLNNGEDEDEGAAKSSVTPPFGGDGIVCNGHVDIEGGVVIIHPLQGGEVIWVATEGESFKKDDVLIRVDDSLAQKKKAEAEIAVLVAEKDIAKANEALNILDQKIKQQEAAIKAASILKDLEKEKLDKIQEFIKKGGVNPQEEVVQKKIMEAKMANMEAELSKKTELEKTIDILNIDIERAELDKKHKQNLVDQAALALDLYVRKAPSDGIVLRVNVSAGETVGPEAKIPALQFCPKTPRIIRAEVQQEFAAGLKVGQDAIIEDDTTAGYQWKGKVLRISDWYTHKRSMVLEPLQFNDVRTLECIIQVIPPEGQPLRIGQRMRVKIHQGGP